MIRDQTIGNFLDQLASSNPTPGGGGAAAVMGAIGAALVSMMCNLTIGKKNYAEVEADMRSVLERAEGLRARLTEMVAEDVKAFDTLMAAYGLPKESDADKAARTAAIQLGLQGATDAPLACARVCADVIALAVVAADKGNRNVISDAAVAALAAQAALRSAALNVFTNVPAIKDAAFADSRRAEVEALLESATAQAEQAYQIARSKM